MALEIARSQASTAAVDAAAAEVLGVNPTDLRCLGRLHAAGSMTAGALAKTCGLSKGAMTTALDRLEGMGYVRRVRREADRRRVTVEVMEKASDLMAAIWGPIAVAGKAQLAGYTAEQMEFLADFLRLGRELQEREAERVRRLAGPSRR